MVRRRALAPSEHHQHTQGGEEEQKEAKEEEEEEEEAVTHRAKQPPVTVHGQVAVSSQPLDHHLPHRRGLELQPDWGRRHLVSDGTLVRRHLVSDRTLVRRHLVSDGTLVRRPLVSDGTLIVGDTSLNNLAAMHYSRVDVIGWLTNHK